MDWKMCCQQARQDQADGKSSRLTLGPKYVWLLLGSAREHGGCEGG